MAQKAKGNRKIGRQKKKKLRRGNPESQYVRGQITFDQYQKLTKVKSSK
jgi:hypothetical protein